MKKILLSMACLMAVLALSAQSTAKKFVLNLTADGESNLTCYLPQNPSGRHICPHHRPYSKCVRSPCRWSVRASTERHSGQDIHGMPIAFALP